MTAVIVGTVGLGIGATTVAFSAVHAALLRPLPYPDPERLVRIYTDAPPNRFRFSVVDYRALEAEQTRFEKNLKPVTDSQDKAAFSGEVPYQPHDRRKACDRPGAEIIAVGKAAGQHYRIKAGQRRVLVPDHFDRLAEHLFEDVLAIVVAITSRKNDDADLHNSKRTTSRFFHLPPAISHQLVIPTRSGILQ